MATTRSGKTAKETVKERTSFKWSNESLMSMAVYVKDNYSIYKNSLGNQRKMEFLRKMKAVLKLTCNETQLKNGFNNFMKRYERVKAKLASSGFGIDPDKDSSLNKGWVLKECPYYEELDEVMGTRPNLVPPSVISTSIFNLEENNPATEKSSDDDLDKGVAADGVEADELPDLESSFNDPVVDQTENSSTHDTKLDETSVFVKKTLSGLQFRDQSVSQLRTPMGLFAKVMEEKIAETTKVEREKMQIMQEDRKSDLEIQRERNLIEARKVDADIEADKEKLALRRMEIDDRKAAREHELQMMKLSQEHELAKLKLQLQLNTQ